MLDVHLEICLHVVFESNGCAIAVIHPPEQRLSRAAKKCRRYVETRAVQTQPLDHSCDRCCSDARSSTLTAAIVAALRHRPRSAARDSRMQQLEDGSYFLCFLAPHARGRTVVAQPIIITQCRFTWCYTSSLHPSITQHLSVAHRLTCFRRHRTARQNPGCGRGRTYHSSANVLVQQQHLYCKFLHFGNILILLQPLS